MNAQRTAHISPAAAATCAPDGSSTDTATADSAAEARCITVRPARGSASKQGHEVFEGISAQSAGAHALCLHIVSFGPGDRARAHLHRDHESAVYMLAGDVIAWYGTNLEHRFTLRQGEMAYIRAGLPHLPINASASQPAVCVIARSDPNEQEGVELLPDLDDLPHVRASRDPGPTASWPSSVRAASPASSAAPVSRS
jgi:uncharacterized RmlC-like cupin family protein